MAEFGCVAAADCNGE